MSDDGSFVYAAEPVDVEANALAREIANASSTGTTINKLAKLTGAPSTALITATTDTSGAVGIVIGGAGTSGNAKIAVVGEASCAFDGATIAGDYVAISSGTAGDCTDAGATFPSSGQVLGRVLATLASAGNAAVDLFGPGSLGSSGGGGSGTVTEQKDVAAGGLTQSGNCANTSSNAGNPCTFYTPGGFVNALRNNSLTSWFHGCVSAACTITTAGGWCAEGVYVKPTGASVTCQQTTTCPTGNLTYACLKITSASSVTAIQVRFVVESYRAASLAGAQTTFQMLALNNCGSSVTPTIAANYPTAQDNYASTGGDLSSANLQAIANAASGTEAYSWQASASITAGKSIDIGLGSCGASGSDSFTIGGGFDWRATPGASTGTISSPPPPEIRNAQDDVAWNERFFQTTYDNGTAPGASTHTTMCNGGPEYSAGAAAANGNACAFRVRMRADPTMSYWDGAGNSNVNSRYYGGAWHDNEDNITTVVAGQTGVIYTTNSGAGGSGSVGMIHYTADATISGG